MIKSKYDEDKVEKNHSYVWGSWWNAILGWGYACCHSDIRGSMCLGDKGKSNSILK